MPVLDLLNQTVFRRFHSIWFHSNARGLHIFPLSTKIVFSPISHAIKANAKHFTVTFSTEMQKTNERERKRGCRVFKVLDVLKSMTILECKLKQSRVIGAKKKQQHTTH